MIAKTSPKQKRAKSKSIKLEQIEIDSINPSPENDALYGVVTTDIDVTNLANDIATALPMPLLAPVINAVLFAMKGKGMRGL